MTKSKWFDDEFHTPEAKRARYGLSLKRHRDALGLSQRAAAEKAGVDQALVGRAEKGNGTEETFSKLERAYEMPNPMPAAPRDPVRREEWIQARNDAIRGAQPPPSGTFGKGVPPAA
jgi:DNA-binding XRE family transcriptional regulator